MAGLWRILYDAAPLAQGYTEQEWDFFPQHGVLFVRQDRHDNNPLVHIGMDYYWLENGQVKSCNARDLDRYLERRQGLRCIKFGRWADDAVWEKAHAEAMKT